MERPLPTGGQDIQTYILTLEWDLGLYKVEAVLVVDAVAVEVKSPPRMRLTCTAILLSIGILVRSTRR